MDVGHNVDRHGTNVRSHRHRLWNAGSQCRVAMSSSRVNGRHDRRRPFGGTCALRGCDPKKVLVGAPAALGSVRALADNGVRADGIAIDWPALMRFKRSFTDPVPSARRAALPKLGVDTFDGAARSVSPSQIAVDDTTLQASRAIVIATGAKPAPMAIEGAAYVITSDDFLELDSLPAPLVFIGGGYISFEFAHVAARAGARDLPSRGTAARGFRSGLRRHTGRTDRRTGHRSASRHRSAASGWSAIAAPGSTATVTRPACCSRKTPPITSTPVRHRSSTARRFATPGPG